MVDHYATLGLHKGASEAEIKKAYKKLAMIWHPDRNRGDEKTVQAKFVSIKRAHDILLGLEEDTEAERSRSESEHRSKPFDPFDEAGSPPRAHDHSSGQRRRHNTNANNYNDFAYKEPKRRGRAHTAYSHYPDASEGRHDTYAGRSRSNTQHDHFRDYEKPSHTHRQKTSSYYEEPSYYEYREPRDSSHYRPRAPSSYKEPSYQEPSYTHRPRAKRSPSYHQADSRYEEPSYTYQRAPYYREPEPSHTYREPEPSYTYREPEPSYTYREPRDHTHYEYRSHSQRRSSSEDHYSPNRGTSSYSRHESPYHGTPSRSSSHHRVRRRSISPQRYEPQDSVPFDFRDLHIRDEPIYESDEDFHMDAMRSHDRVHTQAMRDAERWGPRQYVGGRYSWCLRWGL